MTAPKSLKSHKCFDGQVQFWEHDSRSTGTKMKFSTFVPDGKPRGCLIFLAGLECSEENFITKAGAPRALAREQLMVICPDTSPRGLDLPREHESWDFGSGAGFYVDAVTSGYKDHYRMYSYVAHELYQLIQENFPVDDRISITGHSMGGHGALVLGLREKGKFKSISAFAPIVNPVNCPWGQKAFTGYFGAYNGAKNESGNDAAGSLWHRHDACELVKSGAKHPQPILVDQGTSDRFLETQLMTDNFIKACQTAGQPLEAHYREGYDHSYYFISTFVDAHVDFHSRALKA